MYSQSTNYIYILICLILWSMTSCKEEKSPNATFWGETGYYKNFLFYKYKPEVMEQTLIFDFNEDAKSVQEVKFGLYKKSADRKFTSTEGEIVLYKNGDKCINNVFTVSGTEREVTLGIEFLAETPQGVHKWYLRTLDNGGLSRINDCDIESDAYPLAMEIYSQKEDNLNPLLLGIIWFLIVSILIILVWILILKRIFYPVFKIGPIVINGTYYSMRKIKGYRKVICTNRAKKQSFINQLFIGKILYEVNPFWSSEWVIIPRDKTSIKPIGAKNYTIDPYTVCIKKGVEYTITNNISLEKIKLILN